MNSGRWARARRRRRGVDAHRQGDVRKVRTEAVGQVRDGPSGCGQGWQELRFSLGDNKVSKDFHGKVCKGTFDGVSVIGFVKTEGGKQAITASKIAAK